MINSAKTIFVLEKVDNKVEDQQEPEDHELNLQWQK